MRSKVVSVVVLVALSLSLYAGNVTATPASGFVGVTVAKATFGDLFSHVNSKDPQRWNEMIWTHGASDLYVQQNTWQPGGSTGWHTHPGPSFVIVTQGSVTVYEGDDKTCTPHVYTANTPEQLVRRHRRRRCASGPERDQRRRADDGRPARPGGRHATVRTPRSRPLRLLTDAHAASAVARRPWHRPGSSRSHRQTLE